MEKDLKKYDFELTRLRKKHKVYDEKQKVYDEKHKIYDMNLKESKQIFKKVLAVKLKYEELIALLCRDREIKTTIRAILHDLDLKKLKEDKRGPSLAATLPDPLRTLSR